MGLPSWTTFNADCQSITCEAHYAEYLQVLMREELVQGRERG